MGRIQSYEDLIAWQKSLELGLRIYEITKTFPPDERFGLTAQLRRGGVSVASNIAEGYGRASTRDYVRFVRVSRGALYELETQLRFAERLDYITTETATQLREQTSECSRIIGGLLRSLESTEPRK